MKFRLAKTDLKNLSYFSSLRRFAIFLENERFEVFGIVTL